MPIGDLLASISGEKPADLSYAPPPSTKPTPPVPVPISTPLPPKRKAQDDICAAVPKAPRTATSGSSMRLAKLRDAASSTPPLSTSADARPSTTKTVSNGASGRPAVTSRLQSATPLSRRLGRSAVAKPTVSRIQTNGRSNLASATPSPNTAPKKGSYAEVMKRARESQKMRETIGMIQHEKTEARAGIKERKGLRAEEARGRKSGAAATSFGARNGALPGAAAAVRSNGNALGVNGGTGPRGKAGTMSKSPGSVSAASSVLKRTSRVELEDKKPIKKAATATTGYTGTARPRPGSNAPRPGQGEPTGARPASGGSDSASRQRKPSRYGGPLSLGRPTRRRDEDEDEDMDDFIDYDEDEDDPGYGGRYEDDDRDDESDMEAGMSDIDREEQEATVWAREEDRREEAMLEKLRRAKEERKKSSSGPRKGK